MHLARFPRRRYTPYPTPIERLDRLSRHLAGPDIYIKRDDLLGLAAGGNKTRKLEFLVADALARGVDTLITVGAVQSNHCRLTLAAAVREGLKCRLVLEQRVPGSYDKRASGNNFLYELMGVEAVTVVDAGADLTAAMQKIADELKAEGRKGYIIPGGGSNALGALGYVACAEELLAQTFDLGLKLDHIVCASGSTGTHAGLLTGLVGNNAQIPVTGINVRRPRAEQEANVHALALEVAKLLAIASPPREKIVALDEWVGPGYALPTAEMIDAVRLAARIEGVLLDPVYTGKAMAGLIALVRRGAFKKGENVLFLHTGGSPALYAYQKVLQGE
jgi:D-cysteine desulfhydrase